MKKFQTEAPVETLRRKSALPARKPAATPAVSAPALLKGTDRAIAELEAATERLAQRRARDMLPGRIVTRRLVLRAPIRGDVPDLVRLADNKTIAARLSRLPSPYTRADAIGFVEIIAQRADERPYAITLEDRLIGIVGFSFAPGKRPGFGYWLGEPYWGKGFMTEAARAVIEAAHQTGAFDTIAALALADNAASLRVLEKVGFVRTGKSKGEVGMIVGKPLIKLELKRPRWM
ncbi:MAG: GNAT family N-acetyltransferase [Devosia sp.]